MRISSAPLGIWSRLVGIVFVFTVMDVGIYTFLDEVAPGLSNNVETNIGRAIFALACMAVIFEFLPEGKTFFRLPRVSLRGWIVVGVIFIFSAGPNLINGELPTESVGRFFDVLLFSMMIGVAEEFFCRGLIFQLFQRIGFWTAVHFSALGFGVMHFYNLSIGRNFTYTVYQVIDAAVFGYLTLGLMIFTGSIWVPILLHGLVNLPVITIEDLGMGDITFSWMDALYAGVTGVVTIGTGLALIWARRGWPGIMVHIQRYLWSLAEKMKLVE